jgi:membrane protein DedA with SNARE-associated domain
MEALVDFLRTLPEGTAYLAVFGILLICGLGVPIPEDITLIAGGLLVYYGESHLASMILVSLAGVLLGDAFIFWLGHKYGRRIAGRGFFKKLLPSERLDSVSKTFRERGTKLLFAARFMPGLRAPIFFSAGTLHVPFRTFLFYDGGAALLSVPAIVGSVYYFGEHLDRVIHIIQRTEYLILALILAAIGVVFFRWKKKRSIQQGT